MPELKGAFLTGRPAKLPSAAAGKIALVEVGFSYDSRFAVEAWTTRFRKDFGSRPEITFFEVPVIGGMARIGKWFIDSGMRSGTPPADREHVITVYGDSDVWKQRLGFQSPEAAYLILLDPKGAVRWRHNGAFDEKAYAELAAGVKDLQEAMHH
jgi:hypothetical protein